MFSEDLSELFGVTEWPHLFDARGPRDCKNNTGWVFFSKESTTAPPPLITCYSKKNITFFVFSINISQYLTLKTAPRPYVHVFVCGYGSHSANPFDACSKSKHVKLLSEIGT